MFRNSNAIAVRKGVGQMNAVTTPEEMATGALFAAGRTYDHFEMHLSKLAKACGGVVGCGYVACGPVIVV